MDIESIKKAVKDIDDMSGDNETAHCMEDELYLEAIRFISNGGEITKEMADEILKVNDLDYCRWYA